MSSIKLITLDNSWSIETGYYLNRMFTLDTYKHTLASKNSEICISIKIYVANVESNWLLVFRQR